MCIYYPAWTIHKYDYISYETLQFYCLCKYLVLQLEEIPDIETILASIT